MAVETLRQGALKVAVIGLGGVAEPHLIAYQSLESVQVVGVVEPRGERLTEISRKFDIPGYTSLEALLAHVRPDVACVLTPASTHRTVTEACAKARVHVMCEKPIAVTLEDAVAMKNACDSAGIRFFYGSSYRYLPAMRMAKSLIQAGAIGEVRLVEEHMLAGEGLEAYRPMSAAHYPEAGPGGGGYGLVDHGIHLLDVIPWLCDSVITSVVGRGDLSGSKPLTEYALLEMRSGATGLVVYDSCTRTSDLPSEGIFSEGRQWVDGRGWVGETDQWEQGAGSIRVFGSKGALRIYHYANKLFINVSGQMKQLNVPGGATPQHFGPQLDQFRVNLESNETPATSIDDGIRALRVLYAIYESQKTHRWEAVPGAR